MSTPKQETGELDKVFYGNSQMAQLMRTYNWSASPLGPVAGWPEFLKVSVRIMLASAYPMFVWWGPEMIMFYNDGYIPVLGVKHPRALAQPGPVMWQEVWDKIGPMMENVLQKGETYFEEKSLFYTQRLHFKEETYFTYSYSPVFLTDGSVGGIFCACYEDTPQVLSERRLSMISRIAGIRTNLSVQESRLAVIDAITSNPNDLPFAILYTVTDGSISLKHYTQSAFSEPLPNDPDVLNGSLFRLTESEVLVPYNIPDKVRRSLNVPTHGMIPDKMVILPVSDAGQNVTRGYFVIGLSAVLPYNKHYRAFLSLLSSQINATVTAIRAFEQERLLSHKLIELDKAKTTFFSNVSHEFRTPLTLILGPLEVLLHKAEGLTADEKQSLLIMQRNTLRLLKQVNTLLRFANVEAGRHNARFVPTDLARATRELAYTFDTVTKQAGLHYTIHCPPLSEPVFVDTEMWEMIVLNLLSNAFKFTLAGSISIELVELERTVELRVSDTGIGIPAHEMPRLFERFHRIEQPYKRTFEGTGIGLALVSELVKLHNGTIEVKSKAGEGSTFIITVAKGTRHLPKDKTEIKNDYKGLASQLTGQYLSEAHTWLPVATQLHNPAEVKAENADEATVLLVEDNPDMVDYVRRLLTANFRVQTASNGSEALELLQHQKPDLILSDVMMPVMDGVTLLNSVRRIPEIATIPFILLSARAGDEDKYAGLHTGADDYLVKPFSSRELITRISASIKNARLRNELKAKELHLLKEAETRKELLETILSSISDGFYHITPTLAFTYVNNKALEVTNKTREAHIGRQVLDVYPHLLNTDLYNKLLTAKHTLQPVTLEHYDVVLAKWFDFRIYPTETGTSLYFADITDYKLEEQARVETEKRFRDMANAAPVLIRMTNPNLESDFFNDKWLEFTGRSLTDELGIGWAKGIHPDDYDTCYYTLKQSLQNQSPHCMEYRLLNRHGHYRWILDNGVPRLTEDGQLLGYISACTDITELKWAESLMNKYNTELEKQVALRTTELQEANHRLKIEIKEKIRKKQELMRSHEQLHSLTSHLQDLRESERKFIAREIHDELGQALTALKIEMLLLYDRLSDSKSKYKSVMLESLESMEKALDESLLSMRKIISQLRPSLSDDLELVYEIQKLAADLEKRVDLPVLVNAHVMQIELPPTIAIEVYRVIQESLTNVIKHAKATAVIIDISKLKEKFRFRVSDNGIGFEEQLLQGEKSFGILGIKERAQRIGAAITITSEKGSGTTVELLVDATHHKMERV
ncbi:ATP-binding protein [Pontibacter sp. H259]|uniref:ATP-binding protein n=1 Tax=Pontibacter sp. H259 TaxID=3133421 RepID=UPI0030C170CF